MIVHRRRSDLDGKIQRDLLGIGCAGPDSMASSAGRCGLRGGNLDSGFHRGNSRFRPRFWGANSRLWRREPSWRVPIQVEITQEVRRPGGQRRAVIREIFSFGAALGTGILLRGHLPRLFPCGAARDRQRSACPIGVGALALITGMFLLVLGVSPLLIVGVGAGVASAGLCADSVCCASVCRHWLGYKIMGEPPNCRPARGSSWAGWLWAC
jgi:hypothetical protein